MSKKRSLVWSIDKNILQEIINSSFSIVDVLKKLNLNPYNGNHRTINKRIIVDNLDLSKLEENKLKNKKPKLDRKISDDKVFSENSEHQSIVRSRIIKNSLIKYECSICKCDGTWNNKQLTLQLDHINGINNDNRLENLRFLCPNCHSQTPTFGSKNNKSSSRVFDINGDVKYIKKCKNCLIEKKLNYSSKYCVDCLPIVKNRINESYKKFNPTVEELSNKIIELNFNILAVGRFYNVSDKSIRNRIKKLNIDIERLR